MFHMFHIFNSSEKGNIYVCGKADLYDIVHYSGTLRGRMGLDF